MVARRVKRATTPTGAGGQGQGEAEAPQEESTQRFGGEGELRAARNGGERPTAEWASLGKQKGLRGHIQLIQELRLEMRGDCGRSWRLPAPRAGFGQVAPRITASHVGQSNPAAASAACDRSTPRRVGSPAPSLAIARRQPSTGQCGLAQGSAQLARWLSS